MGECLDSPRIDTPDTVVSRMEVAGGSPPAEIDISRGPDMLQTAVSVTATEMAGWKSSSRYRHLRGSGCAADRDIREDSSVR